MASSILLDSLAAAFSFSGLVDSVPVLLLVLREPLAWIQGAAGFALNFISGHVGSICESFAIGFRADDKATSTLSTLLLLLLMLLLLRLTLLLPPHAFSDGFSICLLRFFFSLLFDCLRHRVVPVVGIFLELLPSHPGAWWGGAVVLVQTPLGFGVVQRGATSVTPLQPLASPLAAASQVAMPGFFPVRRNDVKFGHSPVRLGQQEGCNRQRGAIAERHTGEQKRGIKIESTIRNPSSKELDV